MPRLSYSLPPQRSWGGVGVLRRLRAFTGARGSWASVVILMTPPPAARAPPHRGLRDGEAQTMTRPSMTCPAARYARRTRSAGPSAARGRGFRIGDTGVLAGVGRLENRQPRGVGRHQAVFDAVMHHLDEMAGAIRPAMQIALLGRSAGLFASRRARDVAGARREGGEDRVETLHHCGFAADHHAIAALETPDAAASADIDIVDALGRELLGPADVVDVI